MNKILASIAVLLLASFAAIGQRERYEKGDLKGFLVSWSHEIIELEKPFVVRSVEGLVGIQEDYPLEGVVFEIRGPGESERISSSTTDEEGRFRIKRVPPGTYRFKASKDGFDSIMGTIVVDRKADKKAKITIEMPPS